MKQKIYTLFLSITIGSTVAFAQPVIGLQRTIGGSGDDAFSCMSLTKDHGLVIGGSSNSDKSGNKLENSKGGDDYWILLLNSKGGIRGQKTIGGNASDVLAAVEQTADGGYILGGYSSSAISGDKTENSKGQTDYWIVKLDSAGKVQWDKTIGGSASDYLKAIKQTSDGGYIAGGYSSSGISGDKTENSRGQLDYWVVKLDGAGNIQWDKTIGGSSEDALYDIIQTNDNGYLLGGYSYSLVSGEKTQTTRGLEDYWIVKLDNAGNIQWDKAYGGSSLDELTTMVQSSDGGYVLCGWSASDISGEKMQNSRGNDDYWIVKTDALGQMEWSNTYGGGTGSNYPSSIELTSDGGYIVSGRSNSNISWEKTENSRGGNDYWVIKLSQDGTLQWDKTIGGTQWEGGGNIKQTGKNKYIVAGSSPSGIGGDKTGASKGGNDFWLVELRYSNPDSIAVTALPNSLQVNTDKSTTGFSVYPNPAKDVVHISATGTTGFSLIDQNGKTMFTKTITNNGDMDVSKLQPGVYFLVNKNTGVSQKVVIGK